MAMNQKNLDWSSGSGCLGNALIVRTSHLKWYQAQHRNKDGTWKETALHLLENVQQSTPDAPRRHHHLWGESGGRWTRFRRPLKVDISSASPTDWAPSENDPHINPVWLWALVFPFIALLRNKLLILSAWTHPQIITSDRFLFTGEQQPAKKPSSQFISQTPGRWLWVGFPLSCSGTLFLVQPKPLIMAASSQFW